MNDFPRVPRARCWRNPRAILLSALLLALAACGSSTQSSQSDNSITAVSVSCTPTTLGPGDTSQCTATVRGTGNFSSAVKWSASAGTLSASGLFTAPSSTGNVTITASSTQNPAKSGSASLQVQAPTPPSSTVSSVSVACSPTSVAANAKSQCTATVQGTGSYSSAVNWSASDGAITSSGLFTAPASAATVTISATSVQNTSKSGTASVTVEASSPPASKHVVMVMEENQSYSTIVGSSNWPSLNSLIRNGALATNYYANVHPSIGNYFMLTTGQVLTTDDSSTKVWNVANIARSMLAAGVSFRIYAEGIPGPGYLGGNTGTYLIRHQPFAMLSDLADNQTLADQHIWPFSQFATDLANGNLPAFSFIVPDVNDDAHNGTPQQADSWLQTKVVSLLSNDPSFQPGGGGVLIVDFDESVDSDTTHGGGHIPAIFWGPAAKIGYSQASSTVYQHQSMLRTLMEYLGLPNPPAAAATAPSMSEFFVK